MSVVFTLITLYFKNILIKYILCFEEFDFLWNSKPIRTFLWSKLLQFIFFCLLLIPFFKDSKIYLFWEAKRKARVPSAGSFFQMPALTLGGPREGLKEQQELSPHVPLGSQDPVIWAIPSVCWSGPWWEAEAGAKLGIEPLGTLIRCRTILATHLPNWLFQFLIFVSFF